MFFVTVAAYSTPSPAPAANATMLSRAKAVFAQLQAGKIDRSELTPQMSAAATDAQLKGAQSSIARGSPVSFQQEQSFSQAGNTYAVYLVTFSDGSKVNFVFAVDSEGKVAGMRVTGAP
ncbi:MAG: hypothetical protein JO190_04220 [Candidatus Eremiobacteraeota bacterium]|nr:hypothetical protein [Candidatus Eremiobacteraeota bacterium]MBV8500023.1 hypothetical protein [Candidatus Eremiobacteraeota bacterium]